MVKVSAPAMSLDASGTLAKTMVFSKWKGRNYVRQHVIPANPRDPMQVGIRSMFRFLSQIWNAEVSAGEKATWQARADDLVVSPFNAFMSYNMRRWRNFQAPSKADPAAEDEATGAATLWTATGGVRQATLVFRSDAPADNWGILFFRSTVMGFDTSWGNLVRTRFVDDATEITQVDTPLEPGTYYYNLRLFTGAGDISVEIAERTANVT